MCKCKGFFIGQEVLCIAVIFSACFVLVKKLSVVFWDFLWTGIAVLTDKVWRCYNDLQVLRGLSTNSNYVQDLLCENFLSGKDVIRLTYFIELFTSIWVVWWLWSTITHILMICASCCWVFGAAPACCSDVALNEGVSPIWRKGGRCLLWSMYMRHLCKLREIHY